MTSGANRSSWIAVAIPVSPLSSPSGRLSGWWSISLGSGARSSEATLGLGVQCRWQRPFPQGIDVVLKMRRVNGPHDVRVHARMGEGESKDELHRGHTPEQVIEACLLPALPLHALLPSAGWRTLRSPAPDDDARS